MYHTYIGELEKLVEQVRSWVSKFKVAHDRKEMRDRAIQNFKKAQAKFEKISANKSKASKYAEECKKSNEEAIMAFKHMESQSRQLYNLIEELLNERRSTLNVILGEYMTKSHMFHKKANAKFQTLSSIDAEGHTTQ